MNIIKKVFCFMLVLIIAQTFSLQNTLALDSEPEYVENHGKILFRNIDIQKTSKGKIKIVPKESLSLLKQYEAKNEIEELSYLINKYDDFYDVLSTHIDKKSDIICFSYTEAPLTLVDGHWERVEKEKFSLINIASCIAMTAKASAVAANGNFLLSTAIERVGNAPNYTYYTHSYAQWLDNSILSGSNYPAGNYDYIYQTIPSYLSRDGQSLSLQYNNGTSGVNGTEYINNMLENYAAGYSIVDDPIGTRQMTSAYLIIGSSGGTAENNSYVYSAYVHTWGSCSFDVNLIVSRLKVELAINLGNSDTAWTLMDDCKFSESDF